MSAQKYFDRISAVLEQIHRTQLDKIQRAAEAMAASIARDDRVWAFGSGHSVMPVMDIFPRYGGFVGFFPLYDPRLMWHNVVGPGGARELLWLERAEGYARVFLASYALRQGDCMLVFSHGGMNAAPIEVAREARNQGLKVITVSSLANLAIATPSHSTGKALSDFADIAIDNCVPPEDALVNLGLPAKVSAGSTIAAVFIAQSLVAETGALLAGNAIPLRTFVSPNVPGIEKGHNERIFERFTFEFFRRNPAEE